MRPGRVLIIDDLAKWREQLVETLVMGGFFAEAVSTTTEALQKLAQSYYHLLVVDISMNEFDAGNIEGITFLRELQARGLDEAIQVIVLSAHGTPKLLRESFRYYHVLDFLSKDTFDSQEFLQTVLKLFTREMKINLNLDINWESRQVQKQVLSNLSGNDPILAENIHQELDDLLCRLFYQASGIFIQQSGMGDIHSAVLKVQPFYPAGGRTLILKLMQYPQGGPQKGESNARPPNTFQVEKVYTAKAKTSNGFAPGTTDVMKEEQKNLVEFVRPYIGGARSTTILEVRYTLHLSGVTYNLLGASEDNLEDFAHFYKHAGEEAICHVFEDLLIACQNWYRDRGNLQLHNLAEDYIKTLNLSLETVEALLEEYALSHATIKLSVPLGNPCDFIVENPLHVLKNHSFTQPTYVCITHGMLNQYHLLVDEAEHIWMIHFQKTGRGHFLRDLAMLDSAIRFQLLETDQATLAERMSMEQQLYRGKHFEQWDQVAPPLQSDNQKLVKAYSSVLNLRRLFYTYLAFSGIPNIAREYAIALLYHAFYHFSCLSFSLIQREHALLCASLLAEYLQ